LLSFSGKIPKNNHQDHLPSKLSYLNLSFFLNNQFFSVDDKLSLGCGVEVSISSFKYAGFIVKSVESLDFSAAKP